MPGQIVLAALACFVEMGFVKTAIEDIRVRSKSSNGSIYHHFKSKDQLAAAVYLEGIIDYQDGMVAELEKSSGPREGIHSIVRYHLNWVKANPDWARFLFSMRYEDFMKSAEGAIEERNKVFAEGLSKRFKLHIKEGRLRRLSPVLYISLILGPCQEYARHWLAGLSGADLDFAINEIAEAAWQALRVKQDTGQ